MSQSSLERSTRKSLPAFAHTPSKLSSAPSKLTHSNSRNDLSTTANGSPSSTRRSSTSSNQSPSDKTPSSRYRSTGTGTSYTPRTPQIHYSPHATSTPREALSRSSSIPFDLAASAKAARRAEEVARLRDLDAIPPSGKSKRFVRRKSIWQRVVSFPEQLIDFVALHYPMSFEDILPPHRFANPIGLALHILQWLLLAPLLRARDESTSILRSHPARSGVGGRWEQWEEESTHGKRGLGAGWFSLSVTTVLLTLACANSIYLFTRFRIYDMQLRSANDPISSPHASPIAAPRAPTEGDVFGGESSSRVHSPLETRERKLIRWTWKTLVSLTKWTFWTVLSIFGHQSSITTSFSDPDEKIQSLKVWEPPEFCLAFFCAYPPSAPILSYLLTTTHPFLMPILHLNISFLLSHLAHSYAQLVKDRMVLSAEVMKEYDRRFVYKKVFSMRVDRSVQTEQAESLW